MQRIGYKYGLPRHHAMNDTWTGDENPGAPEFQIIGPAPEALAVSDAVALGHGVSLSPSADGLNVVQFITGLNSSGQLDNIAPNFWNWDGNNPASYTSSGIAHRWTPGSTVSYWFDPASNWTAAEQASFTNALNLWSAVANIHFAVSNSSSNAIDITRGSNGGASGGAAYSFNNSSGTGQITDANVSIDTSRSGWAALDSFSVSGGYGRHTVLHELGHTLGLGHSGPYNGSVQLAQVINTDDTRQYAVMSYVDAGSSIATTVATDNGDIPSPANYHGNYLTTPGQYDILAIQRLYGISTNTPLTVGETFGFNASAALKSSMPQFDFTVNTNPVVTIYDSGTGSTLDLSGFSAASVIDLNPGQFSSTGGMVDNIGIAFNTFIDNAIGGSGDDTFYVNAHADTIDGGGGTDTVVFSGNLASYALVMSAGMVTVNGGGIIETLTNIETLQFADQSVATSPCFVRGTRILTPGGEIAVEALREGDVVCTGAGGERPVKWIGRRTINLAAHPRPSATAPIRIRRDAFGDGQPRRDLLLSPDHAVLVDGALIPAKLLANGCTIVQELDTVSVDYLHVELDRHDIVVADGLAVESYLDTGNRAMFANAGLALILHPDFAVHSGLKSWEHDACAPLLIEGAGLQAARLRLLERATELGWRIADDLGLRLMMDGREVFPLSAEAGRHVFALPAGLQHFQILSRSAIPSEVLRQADDWRQLGVAVSHMLLKAGDYCRDMPVDHPDMHQGWYRVEREGERMWRWTDGHALVSLPSPVAAGALIEIELSGQPRYWSMISPPLRGAA